ncbi:MAG TPA: trypsin-like peptidase domain-containing protein [Mycobacterium sp.]|nr:trypsin-like peptidase domain-containing protein [Mycobacterium sp.]
MRVSAAGLVVLVIGLLAALTSSCGVAPGPRPTTATSATPAAQSVPSDPRVGAVFLDGGPLHTCSAAVLAPGTGDLILTAAHCLADGVDATFVAGFDDHAADEDVWHIDAVYLDQRWVDSQDPRADFAIARVSRDAGGSVRAQAGGGLTLGQAPIPGTVVTVTGYEMGVGGGPISCTATVAQEKHGFPTLPCTGLVDGMSGAPWIDGSTITGLVGGLHGGGCDESVSYSPPFDDTVVRLLARAEAGGPADDAPTAFDDGCS